MVNARNRVNLGVNVEVKDIMPILRKLLQICGDQMAELDYRRTRNNLDKRIQKFLQIENDERMTEIEENKKRIKDHLPKSDFKTTMSKTQASEVPILLVVTEGTGKPTRDFHQRHHRAPKKDQPRMDGCCKEEEKTFN